MQTITRSCTFDSGHRVMNERMKCFNLHGHTYKLELELEFNEMKAIGYAIDFKEIKRVGLQWVDDYFDHGMILNPKDEASIALCVALKSKMWLMSLNGDEYCNPTVENIAKELCLAMSMLLDSPMIKVSSVKLWETPNCFTTCKRSNIAPRHRRHFAEKNAKKIEAYKEHMGVYEYDDREIKVLRYKPRPDIEQE